MKVQRINEESLHQILHNQVREPITCVIKIYSNSCHLCHSLQNYYLDVAKEFSNESDLYFYAFNIKDDPSIEKLLKFKGVPTIISIKPNPDRSKKKLAEYNVIPEPAKPHRKTWFTTKHMRDFIKKEIK